MDSEHLDSEQKRKQDAGSDPVDLDQEICLCFQVSRRKIESFIRIEKPKRAARISECYGAGTGCGWCRQFLVAMFEAANSDPGVAIPSADAYREMRREYRQAQRQGTDEPGDTTDSNSGPEPHNPDP